MSKPLPMGPSPQAIWDKDVASIPESAADWLLPGFVARHKMTLLTSMWKAGKTTLLAHFLARRVTGLRLLDRQVAQGKSIVISEEPRTIWAERCRKFNFGGQLCIFPEPFPHLPTADEWRNLLAQVGQLRADHGIDLLVIDSVTHFLRAENAATGVLDLLMPLRALSERGMAVLLMHHPRRCRSSAGNAGRGHGALFSEIDISIEMRHAGANLDSRARRFYCMSRAADTPRHLLFELNADGADYTVLNDAGDDNFHEHWDVLRGIMEDAPQKLTRCDILAEWPEDFPKPCPGTLSNWLKAAEAAELVKVEGTGKKTNPFRYWVESAEARWRESPFYEMLEKQARDLKLPFVSLREKQHRLLTTETPRTQREMPVDSADTV